MIKGNIGFIILFFIFSIINVDASDSGYEYVCDNEVCYNTSNTRLEDNFYLYDVNKTNVNGFSDVIDNRIQYYIDYYGNDTILIENFCEGDCSSNSDLGNREFTIEELINYNIPFHIGDFSFWWWLPPNIEKSFDNGYDYLFTYFGDIIFNLHKERAPGVAKNQLTDLVGNIVKYSDQNNNFELRNICSIDCENKTIESILYYGNNDVYNFISGTIKDRSYFVGDTFKVSDEYNIFESGTSDSNATLIKAGDTIDFVFSFEDYLDFTENETKYKYVITYNDELDSPSEFIQELTELITVNNDTFAVSSDGLGDNLNDVINVVILDEDSKKIKVSINESFNIAKAGNKNFYLQADNLTSGDSFPTTKVNIIPLEVIASDDVKQTSGLINNFTVEGNTDGYGKDKPFMVTLNLLDENFNEHFDQIDGYEISLSDGNSEYIELSNDGTESSNWGNILTGMTTNNLNQVVFYFRITKPGYYDLTGFDFKVREKIDSSNYSSPENYYELKNVLPGNIFDDDTKVKIHIKTPIYSDLPITCGQDVIVNFICTSDNLSGCYIDGNTYLDFHDESDNGTHIELSIRDNAYNWNSYSGTLNHVDRTAPSIEIFKGATQLNSIEYDFLANSDDLVLKFNETTTENCEAEINYDLKINGSNYLAGSLDFNNQILTIPGFFTGTIVDKKLDIKITDLYGNFNTGSIIFNIYPEYLIDSFNVSIDETSGSKFANNIDEYTYTVTMKDIYGNPIYGKEIISIEQSNNGMTGSFYSLQLNENNNNDSDNQILDYGISTALIENFSGITGNDGSFIFKLKSLTPGKFTEKFNIKIKKWKDDYTDYINDFQIVNIGNILNVNSFKKPVTGKISIDGVDSPALNTNYRFDIDLTNTGNLINISNGKLLLNKDSVINKTPGHNWELNSFKVIGDNSFSLSDMILSFSGTIDATDNYTSATSIGFNDLKIIYKIGGKFVSYFLDNSDLSGGCDVETLGLKVYGTIEGEGKASDVGQDSNFSDLSKGLVRGEIRRNAFILSKNRNSDKTKNINGIIYVEGDVSYSEVKNTLNSNDTIIIKNGNFIIDENINTNIGIIVLQSNFNIMKDYNISGNVYVNKNITKINAIIYSDGAFRSATSDGNIYSDYELDKKLEFNGSLFTRNTIGGSIGENTLPGGKIITLSSKYYLATIYDLNNVRKQVLDCSGSEDGYSFVIRYNSNIQIDPPKGFNIQ